MSGNIEVDKALGAKGYGTFDTDGKLLNVDNYWRKDNAEAEGFDWFGLLPNTRAYWQNGFKVHYEDYYQPKDGWAYNILPNNLLSIEGLSYLVLFKYLGADKTKDLLVQMVKSTENIMTELVNSGKASPYVALNNSALWAAMAHRFSLIQDGGYLKIVDQTRNVISVMQQLAAAGKVLEGVQTLVEGIKGTTILPKESYQREFRDSFLTQTVVKPK